MRGCYLIFLGLLGCASIPYKPGSEYTAPLSHTITHASTEAQDVLKNGAKPQDAKVKTIVKDLKTAQAQIAPLTKTLDSQSKTIANNQITLDKKNHRILMDDVFFGVLGLIILIPIALKILPLLAL